MKIDEKYWGRALKIYAQNYIRDSGGKKQAAAYAASNLLLPLGYTALVHQYVHPNLAPVAFAGGMAGQSLDHFNSVRKIRRDLKANAGAYPSGAESRDKVADAIRSAHASVEEPYD